MQNRDQPTGGRRRLSRKASLSVKLASIKLRSEGEIRVGEANREEKRGPEENCARCFRETQADIEWNSGKEDGEAGQRQNLQSCG